jgi:putative ABC transport system substrate-binding protein
MTLERREFITLLGGAAAWPLAARAQQGDRVRRIGVMHSADENDPLTKSHVSAFTQALADSGWTDGRNVRIDLHYGSGDSNLIRALAQELVGLKPDIIVTGGTPATVAGQRDTQIPIVFVNVSDPVAPRIAAHGGPKRERTPRATNEKVVPVMSTPPQLFRSAFLVPASAFQ